MSKNICDIRPEEARDEEHHEQRQQVSYQEGDIGCKDQATSDTKDEPVAGGGCGA